jgi:hypothetical protein
MRLGITWFCRPFIAGIIAAMASVILVGSSRAQVASPLQPGHYVPGIVNVRDMAAPPDGLFLLWYNWGISSNTFIDRDGNEFSRLNLSEVDPGYPDLDVELELDGFATVPVLAWAKSTRLLGGARYIALVAPNWVTADYKVVGELSEGNVPRPRVGTAPAPTTMSALGSGHTPFRDSATTIRSSIRRRR